METSGTGLVGLSTELIFHIIGYVHPSSHLALALTCSTLHRQSQPILNRHRAAYRIVSDLKPGSVLEVLRHVAADSNGVEAWHVQEMELWGNRRTWADWRAWDVAMTGVVQLAEEEPVGLRLEREEILDFFSLARQWWDMPDEEFDAARNELETGGDGFLKMLLVASRYGGAWIVEGGPPGFQSLRNVAVGVSTGAPPTENDQDDQDDQGPRTLYVEFTDFSAVLNLPGIHNVYVNDLYPLSEFPEGFDAEQDDEEDLYRLDPFSSTVQHIYIDHSSEFDLICEEVLSVGKNLLSVTFRGIGREARLEHTDEIPLHLKRNYPDTFRKLTFYNPDGFKGYRCGVYLPEELDDFPGIRQTCMGMEDIDLQAMGCIGSGPSVEEYVDWWCEQCLPENIEVVMIWGNTALDWFDELDESIDKMDFLDTAIAGMIKSGNYKNLKVIYLDDVERATRTQHKKLCFQKSIAAGREMGVHVYTLINRDDGGYWKEFPAAPDRFDMKTGPFGERPASWRVNRKNGEWDGPGCEGVGCVRSV